MTIKAKNAEPVLICLITVSTGIEIQEDMKQKIESADTSGYRFVCNPSLCH